MPSHLLVAPHRRPVGWQTRWEMEVLASAGVVWQSREWTGPETCSAHKVPPTRINLDSSVW